MPLLRASTGRPYDMDVPARSPSSDFAFFAFFVPCGHFLGPTRSAIGGTLAVSQVNARQPSFQPPSMVASIE